MLQVHLVDLGGEVGGEHRCRGLRSVAEQGGAGRARALRADDAELLGPRQHDRDPLAHPVPTGRVAPVEVVEQAISPDRVGALVQQLPQLLGQPGAPRRGEDAPAIQARRLEPGGGLVRDRPGARRRDDESGALGQVEHHIELVDLHRGRRGETPRIREGEATAAHAPRRLVAQGLHEFEDDPDGAVGALRRPAVDEAGIRVAHRFEGGGGGCTPQLGSARQSERRPCAQLLDDRIPRHDAAGLAAEQPRREGACHALLRLGRRGVESEAQLLQGRGARAAGELARRGEQREGGAVQPRQGGLDGGAVQQRLGEVEVIADALAPDLALTDQPFEGVVVERPQRGSERERRSATRRHPARDDVDAPRSR